MFKLLTFPFRLTLAIIRRIIRRSLRYAWLTIWHSVYYFLKRPIRLAYLLAGFVLIGIFYYISIPQKELLNSASPLPPAVTDGKDSKKSKASALDNPDVKLPPITGTIQNGNSAFITSVLTQMQPEEIQQYSGYFLYAMDHTKGGSTYNWMGSDRFFGKITPQSAFTAKSGVQCRRFEELISYKGVNEQFKGVSCQRKQGGWCRLRPNSAYTCGIGNPSRIRIFLDNLF